MRSSLASDWSHSMVRSLALGRLCRLRLMPRAPQHQRLAQRNRLTELDEEIARAKWRTQWLEA
jgi:hypothetical protein